MTKQNLPELCFFIVIWILLNICNDITIWKYREDYYKFFVSWWTVFYKVLTFADLPVQELWVLNGNLQLISFEPVSQLKVLVEVESVATVRCVSGHQFWLMTWLAPNHHQHAMMMMIWSLRRKLAVFWHLSRLLEVHSNVLDGMLWPIFPNFYLRHHHANS